MGIKIKTNIDFSKVQETFLERINDYVIVVFRESCIEAVNYAKETGSEFSYREFETQSGALRASMGFQLYKDGALVEEYFERSQGGNDEGATSGIEAGKKIASEFAAGLDAPIVAVIVAGMPYAIYVESKGYDVLTGATYMLPSILKKNFEEAFSGKGVSFEIITK